MTNQQPASRPTLPTPQIYVRQITATSISMHWNIVKGATKYIVEREGPNGKVIITTIAAGLFDNRVVPNSAFIYRVKAANDTMESEAGIVNVTTLRGSIGERIVTDTVPPTIEKFNAVASKDASTVTLEWIAHDNVEIDVVRITQDGNPLADLPGPTNSFVRDGYNPDKAYKFTAMAADKAGNESKPLTIEVIPAKVQAAATQKK